MKNIVLLLLVLLCSISNIYAQIEILNESADQFHIDQLNTVDENTSGLSGSLFETLDLTFDQITSNSQIKGFTAALLTPSGDVWKRAAGLASEIPIDSLSTDHLMGMGSISKSFVSATLLLLYEDGLIDLDDSIGMYLDGYPNVPGNATIRQILSHRSGINDYANENPATYNAAFLYPDSIWIIDTLLHHYVLAPNFAPGENWSYSNTNYLLAGRIIEKITGKEWYQVVRDRIIDPLQLEHTFTFPYESTGMQEMAHVFSDFGNGVIDIQGNGIPLDGLFSLAASAGNIITTPEDLVIFSEQLHGGYLLKDSTLMEMHFNHSPEEPFYVYGLGTSSTTNLGLENWGHSGSIIYTSLAMYFPGEDMALAVQQNDGRSGGPFIDFIEVFLGLLNAYLEYVPPTGLDEIAREVNLLIYPNPGMGQVIMELPEGYDMTQPLQCSISNIAGEHVRTFYLEQRETQIQLKDLQPGVYFIKARNAIEKLIIH